MTNTPITYVWVCPGCGRTISEARLMEYTPDMPCPRCGTPLGNCRYKEI